MIYYIRSIYLSWNIQNLEVIFEFLGNIIFRSFAKEVINMRDIYWLLNFEEEEGD